MVLFYPPLYGRRNWASERSGPCSRPQLVSSEQPWDSNPGLADPKAYDLNPYYTVSLEVENPVKAVL